MKETKGKRERNCVKVAASFQSGWDVDDMYPALPSQRPKSTGKRKIDDAMLFVPVSFKSAYASRPKTKEAKLTIEVGRVNKRTRTELLADKLGGKRPVQLGPPPIAASQQLPHQQLPGIASKSSENNCVVQECPRTGFRHDPAVVGSAEPAREVAQDKGKAEPAMPPLHSALLLDSTGQHSKVGKGKLGFFDKLQERALGSKFRQLNELLYTTSGDDALEAMQKQPELFELYHEGFQIQTKTWPRQPVDEAIRWLKTKSPTWVVADLGCGDAKLAASVPQTVHSFDLVSHAPNVVACNMGKLPLENDTVDVAVFCLALMGTDYGKFVCEASRVLKRTGWLWIAEVRSRFVDNDGKESFTPFLRTLKAVGFKLVKQELGNTMFVLFQLRKVMSCQAEAYIQWPKLKACMYKKR